jgi:predicted permease
MPDWKQEVTRRLATLELFPTREADFVEEVAQHLEDRYRELVAGGATHRDAHRRALEEISQEELLARGLARVEQQESREPVVLGGGGTKTFLAGFWQDIRYGLRMLRKNPGLTAVVVTTLALGIGANTALYSVVNAVFQRGLPAPSADRLLGLSFHQDNNASQFNFSYPDFEDIRKQENCFSQMFAYRIGLDGLDQGNRPEQIITSFVTGNYFSALNMKPALGRLLSPTEGAVPGSDPVLVLGYTYWRGRFGGDPGIVGKQVRVDGHAFTVVGVAPKGFRGLLSLVDVQAYLPINIFIIEGRDRGWANSRTSRSLYMMGRLAPGVSAAQVQASMDVIASRLARQYPKDWRGGTIETFPGEAANSLFNPTRRTYEMERAAIGLFLGLAGLVLVLACFNVANILLVRATTREHEVAVRAALGASRGRLIRQVILESLLFALLGGVGGLVIGGTASRMLSSIHLGVGVPVVLDFTFDWRVFAVALGFAALSGIV